MRRLRAAGWVVLGLAVLAAAAVVTVGALQTHSAGQFDRWVGWATVAAVPVAAVGVWLVLWDRISPNGESSERSDIEIEDELAAVVLGQARVARSRLIGTDKPGDRAANIGFVKSSGRFREVGGAAAGDLGSVLEYYRSLSPQRLAAEPPPCSPPTRQARQEPGSARPPAAPPPRSRPPWPPAPCPLPPGHGQRS
jgi:hypothetical protein